MNKFSKKTALVLDVCTCILLFGGCTLILLSGRLIPLIQSFLQTAVFHRTFSLDKWKDTIVTLIGFPVFIVLFFNAVFFIKFSRKNRIFLLSVILTCISVLMIYCFQNRSAAYMDSDMASEILLAKECFLKKTFWPRSWFYSTEIRLLNTQLVSTPLFLFTNNWYVIKTLTAVISCAILFFSQFFLLNSLAIKKTWVKFLVCIMCICPCSADIWLYVTFGNYYIPHIVLSFIYLTLYFYLITPESVSKKRYTVLLILFWAVSFLNGLATIRYLLIFVFPLALTVVYKGVKELYEKNGKFSFMTFFINDRRILFAAGGLVLGCIGYVFNSTLLAKLYSFTQWNSTAYNTIGDISITRLHSDIFSILGYKNNISAMTPAGVINLLIYVFLIFLLIGCISFYKNKKKQNEKQLIYITFSLVSFIFTGFLYINMDYIARYFIMEIAFIPAFFAIIIDDVSFYSIHKYILGVSGAIVVLGGSFTTIQTVLSNDRNTNRYAVLSFLEKNNFNFGFATFWNANVLTFISNGKIEIANIGKDKVDDTEAIVLKNYYSYEKWLTPARYYTDSYRQNEKCFLLVDTSEYDTSSSNKAFTGGRMVYEDAYYKVFEYSNPQTLKNSFEDKK